MSPHKKPGEAGRPNFATTRWSMVLAAGTPGPQDNGDALAELCTQYWYPLYAYARRSGHDPEDARDLTQGFFAKLLDKRDLRAADPARGRFRTFLLSSMKNFMAGEWRKDNTLKRGASFDLVSLDIDSAEGSYGLEPYHELSPDAIYERRWALGLLDRAVEDLEAQYVANGKGELFEALRAFLGGGDEVLPYSELSARLGQSEGALRTAVSRLRSRWKSRIRELVAETVGAESEIEDELRTLIAALELGV